jgi:hypothetical protein
MMVIDESGACIDGATIQIVAVQGAGEPIPRELHAAFGLKTAV